MADCGKCGKKIKTWVLVDGKKRNFNRRKYCLDCSPFGIHNTRQLDKSESHTIKVCAGCGSEFCTKKQKYCGTCNFKKRSEVRNKRIYGIVGTACWICGYDKGYEARRVLDFHHVLKKSFGLSSREVTMLSWKRVIEEIKKCVLLCCRCHREQQIGFITPDEIDLIYKEKWDQICIPECVNEQKQKQNEKICPICSKKHINKTYCSRICSIEGQRRFDISKEVLEVLIKERSYESIGKDFGVSGNTIKSRCKSFGMAT